MVWYKKAQMSWKHLGALWIAVYKR
jgi:hypothetical protein